MMWQMGVRWLRSRVFMGYFQNGSFTMRLGNMRIIPLLQHLLVSPAQEPLL